MNTDPATTLDLTRYPLRDIAAQVTRIHAVWIGISTAVVSAGIISLTASNMITAVLGVIPGVLALVGTIAGGRKVAVAGELVVTPVADPRDDQGRALVPGIAAT